MARSQCETPSIIGNDTNDLIDARLASGILEQRESRLTLLSGDSARA